MGMSRITGRLFLFGLLVLTAPAYAQSSTSAPAPSGPPAQQAQQPAGANHAPPTAEDICHAIEQDAAENELPVEFFARVIWQESRFNAFAVSPKGAQGIAQFMPRTADFRGLADPFDPIAALRHAASYLSDLRKQFGNLGLAAAGYNAGPGRVSAWLGKQRDLPSETRNYVAIITGWTADEWASSSPPKTSETTIPQGAPCTQLANLILAKPKDAQRIATYVPPWGAQFAADMSESVAWATYRRVQKRFAALIGNREPMVLRGRLPGLGFAQRYLIRIADNSRTNMENLCAKIIAAGGGCAVLRNGPGVRAVSMN
jgi:soluble lytic murein transglycosylase-like protein